MYLSRAPPRKEFAKEPTQFMTLIPTVHNADTLGHPPRPDQAPDQLLGRAAEP